MTLLLLHGNVSDHLLGNKGGQHLIMIINTYTFELDVDLIRYGRLRLLRIITDKSNFSCRSFSF